MNLIGNGNVTLHPKVSWVLRRCTNTTGTVVCYRLLWDFCDILAELRKNCKPSALSCKLNLNLNFDFMSFPNRLIAAYAYTYAYAYPYTYAYAYQLMG